MALSFLAGTAGSGFRIRRPRLNADTGLVGLAAQVVANLGREPCGVGPPVLWLGARSWTRRSPRVTAHALRHTAASLAISAGANPKVMQRMLGHASAAMTLDVYADLFDSDLDAVADRLYTALAAPLPLRRY